MRKYLRNTLTGAALLAGTMLGITGGFAGGVPSIPPTPPFNDGSQIVSTLNQFIQSLNGVPSAIAPAPGVVALGQFCAANAAGTSLTCNGQRGTAIFQGQASLAAGGGCITCCPGCSRCARRSGTIRTRASSPTRRARGC
jgi:hypothetical protein